MGKIQHLVILSVLLLLTFSQTVNLSQIYTPETLATLGPEYNDPNFIKLIDNYFGCKTWTDGNCAECSSGYVFNKNGVCCVVDQHCQQFNSDVGICENCYTGYSVSANGSCVVTASSPANNGCTQWEKNACVKCSVRFYFNADKVCTAISDHCRDWNSNGECTSCYYGYSVNGASCVQDASQPIAIESANNPLCSKWEGSNCVACAFHSYLKANGICTAVNDFCNTWDKLDGNCLSCYKGYDLVNGTCV
jgi:proprotein convertase subtilisin/kexin type 5